MMTKNMAIFSAVLIVLFARLSCGEEILGRNLLLVFLVQLAASIWMDLMCFCFEANYLEVQLAPNVLSELKTTRAACNATFVAAVFAVSILVPAYPLILDPALSSGWSASRFRAARSPMKVGGSPTLRSCLS
jgi:hypothetical protein